MSAIRRAGSRHLLPMEMYLGVVAISWAMSGGFGTGYLHDQLRATHSSGAWFLLLLGLGLSQLLIAAMEFLASEQPLYRVWRMARIRTATAFVSILVWAWVCKLLWDYPHVAHAIFVLVMLAPATVAAQIWIFVENFKVRLAADEKIPTDQTLRFGR